VLAYLERGFGVLLVGYRGYGGNPGEPTEAGLYDDGRAHLDWLASQGLLPDDLVLYGESLGSAVATQLATERKAAALVLEAPFASVLLSARARYPLFAFDWVIKDKFANARFFKGEPLKGVQQPTVANTNGSLTIGNPYLSPFRAENFDLSLEWYFSEGGLVSLAWFKKDVSNYPQTVASAAALQDIMTPDQFARRLKNDYDKYEKIVKLTGAKVE